MAPAKVGTKVRVTAGPFRSVIGRIASTDVHFGRDVDCVVSLDRTSLPDGATIEGPFYFRWSELEPVTP